MDLGVLIMVQCQACFGEYAPITADWTRYFHVCPPAIVVTVRQGDGSTVRAPLADFAGVSLVRSDAERDDAIAAGVKAEAVAVVTRREDLDRVDRRDERMHVRHHSPPNNQLSETAACSRPASRAEAAWASRSLR